MRLFLLGSLFLCAVLWGNEEVDCFVRALSPQQRALLERFFRALVHDSLSGYVIFGDKPICIEGYSLSADTGSLTGFNDTVTSVIHGLHLWQDLDLSVKDKKCFFLILDPNDSSRHCICINRQAFIRVVEENLSLFRYVLGPTLTAEGLLKQLVEEKEQFYSILKNDNTLLGILLGYGKQNSLLVSRKEYITDAFCTERVEEFPFVSRKERQWRRSLPNVAIKRPSLGFLSLVDEIDAIKQRLVVSRKLCPFASCKIPYFGCEPDSEETTALLSLYEKNREEILKALAAENFLEQTLYKFFVTSADGLDIPQIPAPRTLHLPTNKEEILAQIVQQEMAAERYFQESYLAEFIKGLAASKNDQKIADSLENSIQQAWDLYSIEQEVERCENLQKANNHFQKIASQKRLTALISNKLYYKTLLKGKGSPASPKLKHVSLHYSYSILQQPKLLLGSVVKENVEHFIPGIAQALIGMRRGEQREIHIHPEYGYGEESYLPPNVVLIAKIELVDFEEGEQESPLAPTQKLPERNLRALLAKVEQKNREKYFSNGVEFWDHYKDVLDYQKLLNHLSKRNHATKAPKKQSEFLADLDMLSMK